jgi:hypothetical protein
MFSRHGIGSAGSDPRVPRLFAFGRSTCQGYIHITLPTIGTNSRSRETVLPTRFFPWAASEGCVESNVPPSALLSGDLVVVVSKSSCAHLRPDPSVRVTKSGAGLDHSNHTFVASVPQNTRVSDMSYLTL